MLGKVLGNRYQIVEQLGGGGMALVYRAKCTLLNRDVTIKVLRPEFASDQDFVNRFQREAQAVASLSHPNIVSLYDVGKEEGIQYIVMEYIEGSNLKETIRERGPLPIEEALHFAKQICDALAHAHENNIIHRDIKPHNILITKTGRAKVTDFGIARAVTSSTVTSTGTIVGSVHYISPEQARGETTGTRSDLYSLGVILYEMVTGKVPFEGESPISIALKHIQEQPVPPSKLNPNVSLELEKLILRAMEKNPIHRYQNAREMGMDLKTVLYGKISEETNSYHDDNEATIFMAAVEEGSIEEAKSRKKIRPVIWAVLGFFLLGIAFGLFYTFSGFFSVKIVEVPDVIGYEVNKARAVLLQSGFKTVDTQYIYSEEEKDRVIKQDPAPKQQAKEERPILLTISKGPQMALVPDVIKKTKIDAEYQLTNEGFRVGKTEKGYDNDIPEGAVIEQTPVGGASVPLNSKVDLLISQGPAPQWIEMPDLIGLTLEEAKAVIQQKKLNLEENLAKAESLEYFADYVMGQSPEALAQVQEGSKVNLTVSTGPGPSVSTTTLYYTVPADGEVKVIVIDAKGRREVHRGTYAYQEQLIIDLEYFGRAKIQYYINGQLLNTEELMG